MNAPALKVKVSDHGRQRFEERVQPQDQAEIFYMYIYLFGHDPTDEEMDTFGFRRLPGREYRLWRHGWWNYLVVYDPDNKTFITLLRR